MHSGPGPDIFTDVGRRKAKYSKIVIVSTGSIIKLLRYYLAERGYLLNPPLYYYQVNSMVVYHSPA